MKSLLLLFGVTILCHGQALDSRVQSCDLASRVGFALDGTDESTKMNTWLARTLVVGTGCLAIDSGKTLRMDSQLVTPNNGAGVSWTGPVLRFTSSAGGVYTDAGGTLDLRYASGPAFWAATNNVLYIDHINIVNGGASCQPLLIDTLAAIRFDDVQFVGSGALGSGCQKGVVLGGTDAGVNGTITSAFNGYGGHIKHCNFRNLQQWVYMNSQVNGVIIEGNFNYSGSTGSPGAIIESVGHGSGTDGNRGNMIINNTMELAYNDGSWHNSYTCGIKLTNSSEWYIAGNGFWDGTGAATALCGNSGAVNNVAIGNFVDATGLTYADATWLSNGNFFAQINSTAAPSVNNGSCTGATIGANATNDAGTITGLPSGACTVVLTMATPNSWAHRTIHGWNCAVSNQTTANLFRQSANTSTTVTFNGTSVSGDVLAYGPCIAH